MRYLDAIAVAYGRQGPAQRLARGVRTRLQNSKMDEIFQNGLHEFIEEFIADNNRSAPPSPSNSCYERARTLPVTLARRKLMRIRVSHDTTYRYYMPVTGVIQTLRLTPRNTTRNM